MEEQAYGGAAGYAKADPDQSDSTPLHTISSLSENINASAARVEKFLARFHGTPPSDRTGGGQPAPVPSGHSGRIASAHEAASRLEKLTCELANIG